MHRRTPTARALAAVCLLAAAACGAPAPEGSDARLVSAARVANALVADNGGPHTAPVHRQEPTPPPPAPRPRDAVPAQVRGIYVSSYAAGDPRRMRSLLALADTTEINTFVVDVKDEDGVRYRSGLPLAREAGHWKSIPLRSLSALVDTLRAHGIHPIARIVVFKDPRLSRARPEWSIRTPAGGLWRDKQGITWVSPWDERVWDYNLAVAEEAARAGFTEVQFDYVRFPEAYRSLPRQVHPAAAEAGERTDAIAAFLRRARERLHPLGVAVAADVFGLSMNEAGDVGIGQQWERLSAEADHLLPMVYPSHYFPTHLPGIRRPNRMPYETVRTSVGMGALRTERMRQGGAEPARVVPWIQAFDATWMDRGFRYGPRQARDQIRAVHDVGLEDWIFWHPGSRYEQLAGAFERETAPRARPFTAPRSVAAAVDRFDREGARAARERAAGAPTARPADD